MEFSFEKYLIKKLFTVLMQINLINTISKNIGFDFNYQFFKKLKMEDDIQIENENDNNSSNNKHEDKKLEIEKNAYTKNKEKNEEKIHFFKFLIYNTKIEINYEKIQSYLYWGSITEFAVWLVLLALFISDPSSMAINWLFVYHVARGSIGIIIICKIPKTHEVLEDMGEFENSSLEEVQRGLESKYALLLQKADIVLKPLLMAYFIITIISLLVDIIIFLKIADELYITEVEYRNYFVLISLAILISKVY